MKVHIVIENMTLDDLPDVLAIEKMSLPTQWSMESYENLLSNNHTLCLVALIKGKVVGYVSAFYVPGDAQIFNLAVHPGHRRQAVARTLLQSLLDRLQGIFKGKVFLEVRETNTPAMSLYLCFGFQKVTRRKEYYVNPVEDAVIMALEIE